MRPDLQLPQYQYHADVYDAWDDGEPVQFRWHWPRGTFDRRMSAKEIALFLMPHMPCILPFLHSHLRAYFEFQAMLIALTTWPVEAIDELLPWIKPVVRTSDWDYIDLCIGATRVEERTQMVSYQ